MLSYIFWIKPSIYLSEDLKKRNKQLLTFIEVDMLFCRPRKSDIDRDAIEVNITFSGSAKQHIDLNKS